MDKRINCNNCPLFHVEVDTYCEQYCSDMADFIDETKADAIDEFYNRLLDNKNKINTSNYPWNYIELVARKMTKTVKGTEQMTREELIKAIYDNEDTSNCPEYSCDMPEKEGNTGECCLKCAEKQLKAYEDRIG